MKICPFCREEIHDEAVKCRFCQSSLLPPQPSVQPPTAVPLQDSRQTVYILDQDLIRFGKFAGAVLAVIIAVGVIFFGVDIKESVKEAAASAKEGQHRQRTPKPWQMQCGTCNSRRWQRTSRYRTQ